MDEYTFLSDEIIAGFDKLTLDCHKTILIKGEKNYKSLILLYLSANLTSKLVSRENSLTFKSVYKYIKTN